MTERPFGPRGPLEPDALGIRDHLDLDELFRVVEDNVSRAVTIRDRLVYVTDPPYLAKGDFVTNDTEAFQAAIDDVNERGGGVVRVPAGEYILDTLTLKSNVILEGDGPASVLLNNSNTADLISGSVPINAAIRNIGFSVGPQGPATSGWAVNLNVPLIFSMQNVFTINANSALVTNPNKASYFPVNDGFNISTGLGITYIGVSVVEPNRWGYQFVGWFAFARPVGNFNLLACQVSDPGDDGFRFVGTAGGGDSGPRGVLTAGCKVQHGTFLAPATGGRHGMFLDSADGHYHLNFSAFGCAEDGIHLDDSYVATGARVVQDVFIVGCNLDSNLRRGVSVSGSVISPERVFVTANFIKNHGLQGVHLVNTLNCSAVQNVLVNNANNPALALNADRNEIHHEDCENTQIAANTISSTTAITGIRSRVAETTSTVVSNLFSIGGATTAELRQIAIANRVGPILYNLNLLQVQASRNATAASNIVLFDDVDIYIVADPGAPTNVNTLQTSPAYTGRKVTFVKGATGGGGPFGVTFQAGGTAVPPQTAAMTGLGLPLTITNPGDGVEFTYDGTQWVRTGP